MLSFLKNIQALYRIKESYDASSSLIKGITGVLDTLEADTRDIIIEGCITTARGVWLDEWGKWVGTTRYSSENDERYRERIITKLTNSASTKEALKINSRNYYNSMENALWTYDKEDWTIVENWVYINLLSQRGKLSQDFVFPDADFYNWCTIQITSPENITPEYKELIDSIKAAGIKVYYLHDILPRTFLKIVDWFSTYQAWKMYFEVQNKGELHGYFSGILSWYGYYGNNLPLGFDTGDSFNEILSLGLLSQMSPSERQEVIERLNAIRLFYSKEEYDYIRGILFHIWDILGRIISGTFEPIFISNLMKLEDYNTRHRVINSAFHLYHMLHINFRIHSVNLVSSSGVLLDNLPRVRFIQDWWSQLYSLEDAMDFHPSKPLYDLDFETSMHITKAHKMESKIFR